MVRLKLQHDERCSDLSCKLPLLATVLVLIHCHLNGHIRVVLEFGYGGMKTFNESWVIYLITEWFMSRPIAVERFTGEVR